MDDLSRRELIKIGAAATVAASVGAGESLVAQTTSAAASRFFTREELALVDELSEMIIPTDAHSPGARAAGVAAYLDARLAEAIDPRDKTTWRDGLALVERLSQAMNGMQFLNASATERIAVLTRLAQNEANPKAPEELFFAELKSKIVRAYYTSEIGIKQDLEYNGNTYLAEFAGFDVR